MNRAGRGCACELAELMERAYPTHKRAAERANNPASYWMYRPSSWPIVWMCSWLGISPTCVTAVAFLAAVSGLILLSTGLTAVGAAALNAAYVLDQVDGGLARGTGRVTRSGAWLDSLVGFACTAWWPAMVGLDGLATSRIGGGGWLHGVYPVSAIAGSGAMVFRKLGTALAQEVGSEKALKGGGRARRAMLASAAKAVNSFGVAGLWAAAVMGVAREYAGAFGAYQIVLSAAAGVVMYRRLRSWDGTGGKNAD